MKLTITAAAALIGLATAFGPAGAAPVSNLPDGTQVIEVDGRDFGRQRSCGRDFGRQRSGGRGSGRQRSGGRGSGRQRSGGRDFGRHGGGRGYGGYRSGRYYGRHSGGHSGGHGHHQPYVYGGIALGTYLFLDALNHD
jgi:hypothetical protein